MLYAGIDLHKRSTYIVVQDQAGKVVGEQNMACDREEISAFFSQFDDRVSSVIEATANWPWLVNLLRQKQIEVCLAHPMKVKAIASAKIKNDRIDAKVLSHLLRSDLVPTSYIPTKVEQNVRELLRFRHRLVQQQTKLKNTIQTLLAKENIVAPMSDVFGVKGRIWLQEQRSFLGLTQQLVFDQTLIILDDLKKRIKVCDPQLKQFLEDDTQAQRIATMPGFGTLTSVLVSAECGDISRFSSDKQLCSYVGLVPSTYSSGNTTRHGKLTKTGNPYVRWALVQAAHRAVRKDPYLKMKCEQLAERVGKKKAIVAIARKLLVSIFFMITRGQNYEWRETLSD